MEQDYEKHLLTVVNWYLRQVRRTLILNNLPLEGFNDWWAECMEYTIAQISLSKMGQREMPSEEQLLGELPKLNN